MSWQATGYMRAGRVAALAAVLMVANFAARPAAADKTAYFDSAAVSPTPPTFNVLKDAYNYVREDGGIGKIIVKQGVHTVPAVLGLAGTSASSQNINARLIFEGEEGPARPVLRPGGNDCALLTFRNAWKIVNGVYEPYSEACKYGVLELRNLEFDANHKGGHTFISVDNFWFGGLIVDNCYIHGTTANGIHTGTASVKNENSIFTTDTAGGFNEIRNCVFEDLGLDTKHPMYLHDVGKIIVTNTISRNNFRCSQVKLLGKNVEVTDCVIGDLGGVQEQALLDWAVSGQGLIRNCVFNRQSETTSMNHSIQLRNRRSRTGSDTPKIEGREEFYCPEFWDFVRGTGYAAAAPGLPDCFDGTNPNIFQTYVDNCTFNFIGDPTKGSAIVNEGTLTVCDDDFTYGALTPRPAGWFDRSIIWHGNNTYAANFPGDPYRFFDDWPALHEDPETKNPMSNTDGIPAGYVQAISETNVPWWRQPKSKLPSEDLANLPTAVPPSAPGPIEVVYQSNHKIILKWAPATDDVALSGYYVYRDGMRVNITPVSFFVDRNVTPGASHLYEVKAFDIGGNFAPTVSATVTASGPVSIVAWDTFDGSSGGWSGAWSLQDAAITPSTQAFMPSSMIRFAAGNGTPTTNAGWATRTVNLSGATAPCLSLQWCEGRLEGGTTTRPDGDTVKIQANDGTGWTTLFTINCLSGLDYVYYPIKLDLSPYAGKSAVQIRFLADLDTTSDNGDFVYFDYVEVLDGAALPSAPATPQQFTKTVQYHPEWPAGNNYGPNFSWVDASNNEDGFLIERRLGSTGAWEVTATVPKNMSNSRQIRINSNQYEYRIRAFNYGCYSEYRNEEGLTPDTTPPANVTDLAVPQESLDSTRLKLTWTAVGDDGLVGQAYAYELRYSTTPIDASNFASATAVTGMSAPRAFGSAESFTATGLQPQTTYYFALKVRDESSNWSGLAYASGTTLPPDTVVPDPVSTLSATSGSAPGSVALTWIATGDDGNTGTAANYEVRYSTQPLTAPNFSAAALVSGAAAPQVAGTPQQMTVTGLTIGQRYWFAMRVMDDSNNVSEMSNLTHAKAAGMGQVILQSGLSGYAGVRDGYVQAASPGTNFNTAEYMRTTGYAVEDGPGRNRAYVKFDLTSIPAGTIISSARLYLYSYNATTITGNSGSYGLYRITRDWLPGQVTWNSTQTGTSWTTPGMDVETYTDAEAPRHVEMVPAWYEWNVTSRVQGWITNANAGNYGWAIILTDETLEAQDDFYQSQSTVADKRPMLAVTTSVLTKGDINGDGGVDVVDLLYLVESFGAVVFDPLFNPDCDLNGDCGVDVVDLLLFVEDWPQ